MCAVVDELPPPEWPLTDLPAEWPTEWPTTESRQPLESSNICWPNRAESSASYERLVTGLLAQHAASHPATLLFTSPGDGDGKTELLMTLAPLLAARAQRGVLVVDGDFRRSDLTTRLAAFNDGLAGLLAGTSTIAEVVCATTRTQLSILPHGNHLSLEEDRDAQLSAWKAVLDDLKCRYPLVLLDAPSLANAHVAMMASFATACTWWSGWSKRRAVAVRESVRVIEATGGRLLGCVAISG